MDKTLRKCIHCGLEALTIDDLKNFTKNKRGKYGRGNSCHRCTREHRRLPKPSYLRKCRVCGLEAHTLEKLELFTSNKTGKFKKGNLCKECVRKAKRKPKPPYLKKCRVCGIEAHTQEDLEQFYSNKKASYGKANFCKKCGNKKKVLYTRKNKDRTTFRRRQLNLIAGFPKPILCHFCSKQIIKLDGVSSDSLIIHSLDGNHENWEPPNKVPCHQTCHISYHNKNSSPEVKVKRILGNSGKKHYNWKGEEASDIAKYYRNLRAKRRKEKIKKMLE